MILLLDHDDSFVHILASYLAVEGANTRVVRDRDLSLTEVQQMSPRGIILSPGPGAPEECLLATEVVRTMGHNTPILGVCLGHQVIACALGAAVSRSEHPLHGITSTITHDEIGIFNSLPNPLEATRYHSLAVDAESVPRELVVTAHSDDGEIMGLRHENWPITGLQFHPESVLTTVGTQLIKNWLDSTG